MMPKEMLKMSDVLGLSEMSSRPISPPVMTSATTLGTSEMSTMRPFMNSAAIITAITTKADRRLDARLFLR